MAHRHTRQVRLTEVGERGQTKLGRSNVVVEGRGASGRIEARYLAGAGVGTLRVSEPAVAEAALAVDSQVTVQVEPAGPRVVTAEVPAWAEELDPAARDVALGAYRALTAVRNVLLR
jgi:hypothetical protein